jgi:hypothetical protein
MKHICGLHHLKLLIISKLKLIIIKLLQKCNIKNLLVKAVAIVKSQGIAVHF